MGVSGKPPTNLFPGENVYKRSGEQLAFMLHFRNRGTNVSKRIPYVLKRMSVTNAKTVFWWKRMQTYPEHVQTYECCRWKKQNLGGNVSKPIPNVCKRMNVADENVESWGNACKRNQNVWKRISIKKESKDSRHKT